MAIDPVCKMQVDESKAAGQSVYQGKTFTSARLAARRNSIRTPHNTLGNRSAVYLNDDACSRGSVGARADAVAAGLSGVRAQVRAAAGLAATDRPHAVS